MNILKQPSNLNNNLKIIRFEILLSKNIIRQYLLAQHAHVCLELEKSLKTIENSANYIQYANELWMSTVVLSKTIASKSRETFVNLSIDSSAILAEAFSAIYLLEQTNLKNLFHEFLTSRTVIFNEILQQ